MCSGSFTEFERPHIPGVQLAAKTADLKELWAALRSVVPASAVEAMASAKHAVAVEDANAVWRD